MPRHSSSQSTGFSDAGRRVLNAVCRSVETALDLQARRRYGTPMTVTRDGRDGTDPPVRLRIACGDQNRMVAQLRVRPAGKSTYTVYCTVEEGPSQTFTYSLPDRTGPVLARAPCLGRKLGRFLLKELERKAGQRYLREQ